LNTDVVRLRLFDPDRRPPDWTDIIRPGQVAAFSKNADTGATCDADGKPFASDAEIACLIFDSLAEARRFCETRVREVPSVRFEIFDAQGRANPPLITILSPSRAHLAPENPRGARVRRWLAIGMLAAAPPLFWIDYAQGGLLILPTFLALNLIIVAARLLFMNVSAREVEQGRLERLARYEASEAERMRKPPG
jgi:hypothetical protein